MDNINERLEYLENKVLNQEHLIAELKKELSKKNEQINSFPQLSATSLGKATSDGKIIYRNWWAGPELEGFCDDIWFTQFLRYHFPDADYKFNIFSVFGNHDNIMCPMDGKKIFYSGECINVVYPHIKENFGNHALKYVDFALGHDLLDCKKYLRFPFWFLWVFPPVITEEDIENTIDGWMSLEIEKSQNVCNVSSHDNWSTRALIADSISDFTEISYGGLWRNNTNDLWDKFNNNKLEFLKNFKFNICAENLVYDAYVTEKVFDSIRSDCIPLYVGGGNYLEPKVLNQNAMLIWDFNKDNSDTIETFKNLVSDEKSYAEFKEQNILLETSSKYIIKKFSDLKKHFENLIYD